MQFLLTPRAWSAIAVTFALFASGCGGGGGGGSGSASTGSQAPQEQPLASAVKLGSPTYTSTKFSVFESAGRLPGVIVTADVNGEVSRLNGKTIYVIVVDPDGLFESRPTLQLGAEGKGNRLELVGKVTQGHVGVFRGNLQVNVCADEACKEPLGNSPMQIPYEITIASGAKFASSSPLVVETNFGDSAPQTSSINPVLTRSVAVTLPADTSDSTVSTPVDAPLWGLGMSEGNLQIAFFDATPGIYDGVVRIQTSSQLGGMLQSSTSDLAIRYIVHANPAVDVIVRPVLQEFSGNQHSQTFRLMTADGKLYSSVSRIVYGPGGTNANGKQWLQVSIGGSSAARGVDVTATAIYCNSSGFDNCLYEGALYQANVYFKTADGIELSTPLAVTLRAR